MGGGLWGHLGLLNGAVFHHLLLLRRHGGLLTLFRNLILLRLLLHLFSLRLLGLRLVGDYYVLNLVTRQRVAQSLPFYFLLRQVLVKH